MFDSKSRREILEMLKGKKAKKILIQVPEGLKGSVFELIRFLEKNGIEVLLSIEPCFGACDLRDKEAKMMGCDILLHIGHRDLGLKTEVPVLYYEYFMDFDFVPLLKKWIKGLKFKKLCLITTMQFVKNLERVKGFLEENGFEVYAGGDVLGCDVSNAKRFENLVDAYLFIGSGRFHPLGLQEKTEKPVLFLDIERGTLENLLKDKKKLEIKRVMRIQKARGFRNFGVVVSTKAGQFHLESAEKIKHILERKGKSAYILVCDQLTPDKLSGLNIDVIVNTACPRIRENSEQFQKIILNPEDVEKI